MKSALLGTRHPRKEEEAALQTVTGKPACLDGKILVSTQSEKEPSVKICKIEVRSSQPAVSCWLVVQKKMLNFHENY